MRVTVPEQDRVAPIREAFAARYGVSQYANTSPHLYDVLSSGGIPRKVIRGEVGNTLGVRCLSSSLFDHPEIWGREGRGLILVGHPYSCRLPGELDVLDYFRERLGLSVVVNGPEKSHYGFGTVQYLVFAAGFPHT